MALVIRLIFIALLVCALAGLRIARPSKELTVVYAVDASDSIPQAQREISKAFIQKTVGEMGAYDFAGMVVIGKNAAIEQSPGRQPEWDDPKVVIDHSRSNLAGAIELAKACFTGDAQKRIIILSDGNQNAGDAAETARSAAAAGIAIDVFPLKFENRNDVILEKVSAESRVNLNEPFDIKIIASARQAGKAKLSLMQDGKLVGQPAEVELDAGKKNVYVITSQVLDPGFHTFEAQLDVPGDIIPENNRAFGFTYGEGEPRVLYVDGDPQPSAALPMALQNEKIKLDRAAPDAIPHSLRDFLNYDCVVFNNVPASAMTPEQMKMLEYAVHDMGLGFIMIGGENSFGAGGYNDSPIERILPVEMEIKNEKILPQGALIPIIHTIEIPEGQYWSEQIIQSALDVLAPRDLMGVLYYSNTGNESWLFPLQEVGDKSKLRGMINTIQPGDMPSFDKTMQMAYDSLSVCGASVKHLVIISDGDPQTPNQALAKKIKDAKITISTVCINPHSPRDSAVMQDLANVGGGNFYNVTSYNSLPQIFIKEAATVRKSLLIEEPFTPVSKQFSPLLAGIDAAGYPMLKGYVGTSPKALADIPLVTGHDDPLFAHWRHGLGKTVAFTSDAKERWAAQWLGWGNYGKFWAQAVRWSLRTPFNQKYQMQMNIDGARGKVVIDAVDTADEFRNLLTIQGRVITPSLEPKDVTFRQIAPGRYEAEFEAAQPGNYMLGAVAGEAGEGQEASGDLITGGSTLSYSPEFQNSRSNEALLAQLADITGGRTLATDSKVFLRNKKLYHDAQKIWPQLLTIALLLFLADVFVRRVLIGWGDVAAGLTIAGGWAGRHLPRRRAPIQPEATSQLLQAKQDVRAQEQQEASAVANWRELILSSGGPPPEKSVLDTTQATPEKIKPAQPDQADTKEKKPAPAPDTFTSQLLQARKKTKSQLDKEKGDPS